jgi:hypothetical protein
LYGVTATLGVVEKAFTEEEYATLELLSQSNELNDAQAQIQAQFSLRDTEVFCLFLQFFQGKD